MKEYRCLKCGETFVEPDDFLDSAALHGFRDDGEFCGGQGKLAARWGTVEGATQEFLKTVFGRELEEEGR
jgi:hypothetical protein